MGKLYDEDLIDTVISDIRSINGNLDGCFMRLQSVVNSDGYYAKTMTGVTDISNMLDINEGFSSYMNQAKEVYERVYSDISAGVGDLGTPESNNNAAIIFDAIISDMELVSQVDDEWCALTYAKDGLGNKGTIGGNGCGPCSIVNALITNFGITGKDNIKRLIIECIKLAGDSKNIQAIPAYLTASDKRNEEYDILNSIKDNNTIVDVGQGGKTVLSSIGTLEDGKIYLGSMNFRDGDNTYSTVINMVDQIYEKYPDANITFYAYGAGAGTTFSSGAGSSGHYISLLINAREFKENGAVYLLDSDPRLLAGETAHGKVNRKYNFVDGIGDMKTFNNLYTVTRESDNVLKVQLNEGEFNSNNLNYLGIRGGTQVIINPTPTYGNANTNGTPAPQINADVEFNTKLADNMPTYVVQDTTNENAKTMARVEASELIDHK